MLQRMFENGNIIPVYSPLVDRLGLGPRLVGRLGFSSASFIFGRPLGQAYATGNPSVRPSVTLVDCGQTA